MKPLLFALSLLLPALAAAATPSAAARTEIAHLLGYLESSSCEFYRNGSWYLAPAASAHLQKKYRYLLDRGLVDSTEDFIDRAASRSSFSGLPYQVRCAGAAPVASGDWLRAELQRERSAIVAAPPVPSASPQTDHPE